MPAVKAKRRRDSAVAQRRAEKRAASCPPLAVIVSPAPVLSQIIVGAECIVAGLQLRCQNPSQGPAAIRVARFLNDEIEGVAGMEIRKEVDVVFEDLGERHDMLGCKPRVDPALIKTVLDRTANDSGLSDEGNFLALRQPTARGCLHPHQIIVNHQFHALHRSVFRAEDHLHVVARTDVPRIEERFHFVDDGVSRRRFRDRSG